MSDQANKTESKSDAQTEIVMDAAEDTKTEDTGAAAATLLGGKPDVLVDAKATEGADKDKAAPTQETPKPYGEFTLPEGVTLDKALLDKVAPVFQKAGVTQETAQEIVTTYAQQLNEAAKATAEQQQKEYSETLQTWEKTIKQDPDFGGVKFDQSVAAARRVIGKFGSPEFGKLLDSTGIGNHPEFFRFVAKVAGAFSESPVINGNKGVQPRQREPEEILFTSMSQ